jgi:hypothetical protein
VSSVGLGLARDLAGDARAALAKGLDPIAERDAKDRAAANALTFRECAARYAKANKAGWRDAKHAAQWETTLKKYVYAVVGDSQVAIGDMPVSNVGVGEVTKVLNPIWSTKTETASRVRGRVETVLDWAKAHGYRTGENPARWRGHLDKLLPARSKVRRVRHHPALPYGELPAFMVDLRTREGLAAIALEYPPVHPHGRPSAVAGPCYAKAEYMFDIVRKTISPRSIRPALAWLPARKTPGCFQPGALLELLSDNRDQKLR